MNDLYFGFSVVRRGGIRPIEITMRVSDEPEVVMDRCRLFSGPWLRWRLARKIKIMAQRGITLYSASSVIIPLTVQKPT